MGPPIEGSEAALAAITRPSGLAPLRCMTRRASGGAAPASSGPPALAPDPSSSPETRSRARERLMAAATCQPGDRAAVGLRWGENKVGWACVEAPSRHDSAPEQRPKSSGSRHGGCVEAERGTRKRRLRWSHEA